MTRHGKRSRSSVLPDENTCLGLLTYQRTSVSVNNTSLDKWDTSFRKPCTCQQGFEGTHSNTVQQRYTTCHVETQYPVMGPRTAKISGTVNVLLHSVFLCIHSCHYVSRRFSHTGYTSRFEVLRVFCWGDTSSSWGVHLGGVVVLSVWSGVRT